jgi:hypothetical protein
VKYSDTYPIPADLQVLQSYKAQMVPFLGSPASLFTYATLTAYSNIFQIVTSRWTKDQVAGWQELINSVAAAIKQKNEEAEHARKSREAEEAAINLLRETSARNEKRIRDLDAMIEQLRKEVELAHAQAAAEFSRASAVEGLIRSVSSERPKESAPAKSLALGIVVFLLVAALVAGAFGIWLFNSRRNEAAQKEALDAQIQSKATVVALQNQVAALNERLQGTTSAPKSGPTTVTAIEGQVVDRSGKPIPGVRLRIDTAEAIAVTDPNGRFRMPIPNGILVGQRITITAMKDGYLPLSDSVVVPNNYEYLFLKMLNGNR